MKNKLISLLLALSLLITPALADDEAAQQAPPEQTATEEVLPEQTAEQPAEESSQNTTPKFPNLVQEQIIYSFAHNIADNYYYGISDENLLYAIICATIENGGKFDLDKAFAAMVDILGDEYADFYPADAFQDEVDYYNASFFGLGIVLAPDNGGTVIDSVYAGGGGEEAGLLPGDRIIAVNGSDVSAKLPADVSALITGEENTTVEVTVLRGEETITVYAVRHKVMESHSSMEILDNSIAYIDVSSFTASLPDDFDGYISTLSQKGVKKVIIDLRDNGGGDLDASVEVAKKLTSPGLIGKIKTGRDGADVTDIVSENTAYPGYDMLVLVNGNTASASEFLAMALQSSGAAKLMGTHTYGKGCMQAMMRTPTGSGIKYTFGEFFTPKDERVNTIGLEPDITVENIVTPIDPQSFSAIDFMQLDSDSTRLGVEQRLNAIRLLPDSETDGVYNANTEAALRIFQRYCNFEETGVLDFYTALRINDFDYHGLVKVDDIQTQQALKYFDGR